MPAGTAPGAGRGWDGLIVMCAVADYDGIHQLVLVCEVLVNGLFGNAQLSGDLIHGDGLDPVSLEKFSGLFLYSFLHFHKKYKTTETFFGTKVS